MELHLQAKNNFRDKKVIIDDAPKVFSDLLIKRIIDYTEFKLLCLILNNKQKLNLYNIKSQMSSKHEKITKSLNKLMEMNILLVNKEVSSKKERKTYYIQPNIDFFWELLNNNKKT